MPTEFEPAWSQTEHATVAANFMLLLLLLPRLWVSYESKPTYSKASQEHPSKPRAGLTKVQRAEVSGSTLTARNAELTNPRNANVGGPKC